MLSPSVRGSRLTSALPSDCGAAAGSHIHARIAERDCKLRASACLIGNEAQANEVFGKTAFGQQQAVSVEGIGLARFARPR